MILRAPLTLCVLLLFAAVCGAVEDELLSQEEQSAARMFTVPMAEIMGTPLYLSTTRHGELVVRSSPAGSDLVRDDYLTHADNVRLLSGGLSSFLASGEKEVVLPVVDDEDEQHGGHRLLGFVMLTSVLPRKLGARRGEIVFDLEEGGPAPSLQIGNVIIGPSGAQTTTDRDYKPPPHGGGACVTGRDCYHFNGTCSAGLCSCNTDYTGSYCQLHRPQTTGINGLLKRKPAPAPKPAPVPDATSSSASSAASKAEREKGEAGPQLKPGEFEDPLVRFRRDRERREREAQAMRDAEMEEVRKKEARVRELAEKARLEMERRQAEIDRAAREQQESGEVRRRLEGDGGGLGGLGVESFASVEDLYGYGKPYPEPYNAGKPPRDLQIFFSKSRQEKRGFLFSVRFRSGPLGLSFDNKVEGVTRVERVAADMQADLSDVRAGDVLVAIDQYNVSQANAKLSQRILASLGWPRILTFEFQGLGVDPDEAKKREALLSINVTVMYPPSLAAHFEVRLAEWAPGLRTDNAPHCPIHYLVAAPDVFGCDGDARGLEDVQERLAELVEAHGFVPEEQQRDNPMLSLLLQEGQRRQIPIELRPLLVAKRGICTFVDKAVKAAAAGFDAAIIVNTEDALLSMPAGKEATGEAHVPVAISRNNDTSLLQVSTAGTAGIEVFALLADPLDGLNSHCQRVASLVDEVLEDWPHSSPPMTIREIQAQTQSRAPKQRGVTEEGGRVAVGGETGWALFDYHLAMFGPQEVPLGPHRLQFAMPPFGCDPAAYTVRVTGTIVAILRGGGCSFGIKVINAQKLGAVAVIIVNTDDSKSMRLMALPDEIPQINIACVMVSRRFQYFLEEHIRRFYLIDQHIVSLQPTSTLGEYETRSKWEAVNRT